MQNNQFPTKCQEMLQDNSIVLEFGDVEFWIFEGYNLPTVIYIFVIIEKNTKTEIAKCNL